MLEIVILSLLVGSLGLQATLLGGWRGWQQMATGQKLQIEEEILTRYETDQEYMTPSDKPSTASPGSTSDSQPPALDPRVGLYGSALEATKNPRLAGWEFKIVRADRDLFRNPTVFNQLCKEEAAAGWILLEKLDDHRVRFKRPIALRDIIKVESLPFDPYRCHYGSSWNWLTWLGAIAALTAILLPAYLGYALVSVTLTKSSLPEKPLFLPSQTPSLRP